MSTPISRRRVVAGATWAIPAVVVGAAAPAHAASDGCPGATLVSAVSLGAAAILTIQVKGLPIGTSQLQVTGVTGAGFGTLPGAVALVTFSTAPVSVLLPLTRGTPAADTGPVSVSFDIVLATGGRRCTGYAVSFTYSTPPPPVLPPVIPVPGPTTTPPVRR